MGWGSGSELFSRVIAVLKPEIPDADRRQAVYMKLIDAFEDMDCDTLDECEGEDPAFDAALKEMRPDDDDDEER